MKPPTQRLEGAGFLLHYNPDTAAAWPCVRLVRQAYVIATSGVIRSRPRLMRYEVYTDGEVRRVDEAGDAMLVPDGHAEWRWARDTVTALNAGRSTPPDLVRWRIGPGSRRAEYTGAPIATPNDGG